MTADDIRGLSGRPWLPQTGPKTISWLQQSLSPEEHRQLKSMGNIVMPQLANLAAHLLSQM